MIGLLSRSLVVVVVVVLAALPYLVARSVSRAAAIEPSGAKLPPDWAQSGLFGNFSLVSSEEPIQVRADQLEFDYKNQVLLYRGGVVVTQGDVTLRSQALTVHFDDRAVGNERLNEIVAEGEVRIDKGPRSATGGRAVFDQAAKTIVLSEDAVLHDGPNRVAGERVIVYLAEGRSVVEGGDQRVHAVLVQPDDSLRPEELLEEEGGQQRPNR